MNTLKELSPIINKIDESYENHPGYKHKLWLFLRDGDYDVEFAKKYSLYYYNHVKIFRQYLAGALSIIPDESIQITLATIIADEYGVQLAGREKAPSHPDMFRMFMSSLGVKKEEWEAQLILPKGVQEYKNRHFSLVENKDVVELIGAIIFGMERTTPFRHLCATTGFRKLKERADIDINTLFFDEHVEIDDFHNESLIEQSQHYLQKESNVERLISGARKSFDARKYFLDDLSAHLGI